MSSTSQSRARRPSASTALPTTPALSPPDPAQVNVQAVPWTEHQAQQQLSAWGQAFGDFMQLWLDQLAQGQRTGLALFDSQMRLWQGMQDHATRLWAGAATEDLHVMPDSAGPVLCPPFDFTPAGLTRSTLGTLQALSAAWSTAVEHELQDLDETTGVRH